MGVWGLGRPTGEERSLEMELWYVLFGCLLSLQLYFDAFHCRFRFFLKVSVLTNAIVLLF